MGISGRDKQSGSAITFVIVAIVLAAILVGLIYGVNQHGAQVRRDKAIAEAEKRSQSEKEQQPAPVTEKSDNGKSSPQEEKVISDAGSNSNKAVENLPTTGPEMALQSVFEVFVLGAAVTSYAKSRRRLVSHL